MEAVHFPWYFTPENCCWEHGADGGVEDNLSQVVKKHSRCKGKFTSARLALWMATMYKFLESLASLFDVQSPEELLSMCNARQWYAPDKGCTLSPIREVLLLQLQRAMGGPVTRITVRPLNCATAILNWFTLKEMLLNLTPEQREHIRTFPLESSSDFVEYLEAADGHCHLHTWLRDSGYQDLKTLIRATQDLERQQHATPMLVTILVNNCVSPGSWRFQCPTRASDVRVVKTVGVHPTYASHSLNWASLEQAFAQDDCVAIGECGLDLTRGVPADQEAVYERQLRAATALGKPVVLHLRADSSHAEADYPMGPVKALYARALEIARNILGKDHPVYLHCYTADWETYVAWKKQFPNLLVGFCWKTVFSGDFMRIAQHVDARDMALETDSPHLSPVRGELCTPWQLRTVATLVARHRNIPLSVLLLRTLLNVYGFFRLDPQ
jgi:TatD DNase family protein